MKNIVMVKAGKKAWDTRKKNELKRHNAALKAWNTRRKTEYEKLSLEFENFIRSKNAKNNVE